MTNVYENVDEVRWRSNYDGLLFISFGIYRHDIVAPYFRFFFSLRRSNLMSVANRIQLYYGHQQVSIQFGSDNDLNARNALVLFTHYGTVVCSNSHAQ